MELKRVLVGLDGSPAATAALQWAADAVRESGGEVVVVHAAERPLVRQAAEDAANGLGMVSSHLLAWRAESGRTLEEEWCWPLREAGVRYRTVLAECDPVTALLKTARRVDADVIVVGHQGDSSLVHRLFRGLSDELLDHARRPVVVVPYSARRANRPARRTESLQPG